MFPSFPPRNFAYHQHRETSVVKMYWKTTRNGAIAMANWPDLTVIHQIREGHSKQPQKNMLRISKNTSAKYIIMNLLLFLQAFVYWVPNPSTKNDQKPARVNLLGNCYHTHIRRKKTISLFEPSLFRPEMNFVYFGSFFQQDVLFCI